MPQFRVAGIVTVAVTTLVEADDEDHALETADEHFDGLTNYAGNGGCDKLVGVYGENDTIEDCGDYPEWREVYLEE